MLSHPWRSRNASASSVRARGEPVAVFDTAGAVAEIVRSGWTDAAAIASRRAADVYGAVVLIDDIQDRPDNVTRFLLIETERGLIPKSAGGFENQSALRTCYAWTRSKEES